MNRREKRRPPEAGVKTRRRGQFDVQLPFAAQAAPIAQDLLGITLDTPDAALHAQKIFPAGVRITKPETHPETDRGQQQGGMQCRTADYHATDKEQPLHLPGRYLHTGKHLLERGRSGAGAWRKARPGRNLPPLGTLFVPVTSITGKQAAKEVVTEILPAQSLELLPEGIPA